MSTLPQGILIRKKEDQIGTPPLLNMMNDYRIAVGYHGGKRASYALNKKTAIMLNINQR